MRNGDEGDIAADGRRLGRRGQATRRRLLEATASQLSEDGIRDLKVVDVARQVGTSPATFYQYFRDVEEAVLALSEEVGEEAGAIARYLEDPWKGTNGLEIARRMVDEFMSFWDEHGPVLRSRNLAAQEGDDRFRKARNRSLTKISTPLAKRIAENQRAGRVAADINPLAAAAAMVAMMERMAAFRRDLGVPRGEMVETVARIIHQTVTGRKG